MCLKLVRRITNQTFIMRRYRMVNKYVICVAVIAIGVAAVYLVANYSFSHVKDHLSRTVAKMYEGHSFDDRDRENGDFYEDSEMYDRDRHYKNRKNDDGYIDDDENIKNRENLDSRIPDYRDRESFKRWKMWRNYKERFNRYNDENDETPRYIDDLYKKRLYRKYGDSYINAERLNERMPKIDDDTYKLRDRPGKVYGDGYGRMRQYDDLPNQHDETANERINVAGNYENNPIDRQNFPSNWNNEPKRSDQDFERENSKNDEYGTTSPFKRVEELETETTETDQNYDYASTVEYPSNQILDSNPSRIETGKQYISESYKANNDVNTQAQHAQSENENNDIDHTLYDRKMILQQPNKQHTTHKPSSNLGSKNVNLALGALAKVQQVPQYITDDQDKLKSESEENKNKQDDTNEDPNGINPAVQQAHPIDNNVLIQHVQQKTEIEHNGINQVVKQEHAIDHNGINPEIEREHAINHYGTNLDVQKQHAIDHYKTNLKAQQQHVIDPNELNPKIQQEHEINLSGISPLVKQEQAIDHNGINQSVKLEHLNDENINNQYVKQEQYGFEDNKLNPDVRQERVTGNNLLISKLRQEHNAMLIPGAVNEDTTQNHTSQTNMSSTDEEYKKMMSGLSHDEILKRIQDAKHEAHPFIKIDHRKYAEEHKIRIFDWTKPIEESLFCQKLQTKIGKPKICLLDPLIDPLASKSLFEKDFYEQDLLNEIEIALSKDPENNLIDIGANVGVYTLTALQYGRQVFAIEPDYKFIPYLHKSIVVNNFQNRTTLILNAISYTQQTVQLKLINDKQTIVPVEEFPPIKHVKIPSITLDEVLPLIKFQKTILKIDIPTPVSKALLASTEFFNRLTIPYIFMNWNYVKEDDNAKAVADFLRKYGYRAKKTIDGELLPLISGMWEGEIVFVKF